MREVLTLPTRGREVQGAIMKDVLVSTRGKQPNAAREEGKEGRRWEEES